MDAKSIQRHLLKSLIKSDSLVFSTNMILAYEADVVLVKKSMFMIEFEIKISKSDFKADFCKAKHIKISGTSIPIFKHDWLKGKSMGKFLDSKRPNKFYFVFPKGIIYHSDVPDHCGIIEFDEFGFTVIRKAPFLHRCKVDEKLAMDVARNACIKLSQK